MAVFAIASTASKPMNADNSVPSQPLITPAPLQPGDRIAILSPAGAPRPQDVYNAIEVLRAEGWDPYLTPHALGRSGTFSGTPEERLADLRGALTDSATRAIICTRGGYGAVHLLDSLDSLPFRDNAKWLVGFSDISALHALMHRHGIASIHGPMCKHIVAVDTTRADTTGIYARALFGLLRGEPMDYRIGAHPLNRAGRAEGTLVGGNLAVLQGLIDTPYDMLRPGTILFIEDIAEPVYKVERILWQLRMSGVLERLAGLIVGDFTDYEPDVNHDSMESMIASMVAGYGYPVAFGVPVGHGGRNLPLVEGAGVEFTVGDDSVVLRSK